MAKSVGSIEIILGKGTLINLKGEEKKLVNNLKLFEDDVLATGDDTTLLIKLRNGHTISLGANRILTLDDSVMEDDAYSDADTQAEVAKIQEILAESTEEINLEETAAGESSTDSSLTLGADSIALHNENSVHTTATILDNFKSNTATTEVDDADSLVLPFDTQGVIIGISNILTNDTTPFISGTTNDTTADILINVGGNDYTATNHGDGTWSLTVDQALNEGDNAITVSATDPSGNTTEVKATLTVDTILSDANNSNGGNIVTIESITQDTGSSSSDFITKDANLIINGTFDNEDGNTIRVTVDGTEYAVTTDSNLWELNLRNQTFNDGEHEILAIVKDAAGNEITSTQTLIVDTQTSDSNDTTITLDIISDDNIINKIESSDVTISGSTTATNGSIVSLYIGNSLLSEVNVVNGTFSYDVPQDLFGLYSDGIYEVRAEVLADTAGNTALATQTVTLDTQIDTIYTGGLDNGAIITIDSITQDTGVSDTDFITSDTTLTVKGTYDNATGNTLEILVGGVSYTPITDGNAWEVTLDELSDGENTLAITISDTAGNTKTITQNIIIDTLADSGDITTSATISLDNISDGFLNANEAGNILTLSGSSNVIGAEVLITLNGGDFTSATVDSDGNYSVDVSTTQIAQYPDGVYNVEATITADDAGNSISANQDVTLDTTLDSGNDYVGTDSDGNPANVTIDSITNDDGAANDFITTDKTIIMNGSFNAESGNSLVVKVDSTVYTIDDTNPKLTISGNTWELNLEDTLLSDGIYSVTAIVKDSAGNSDTTEQTIQIVDSTDIGVINLNVISDNYINTQEAQEPLTITGTSSEIGQTVSFTLNASPLQINGIAVVAIVDTNGTFSIEIPANTFTNYVDGEYIVGVSVVSQSDGITYSDSENVFLDRTSDGTDGGGTGTNGDDATISLNSIGDGYINAQEASTGLLVTGNTTAVEGTAISFIIETSNGDNYSITQNSNGQTITANADGTFSAFIALADLSSIDNSDISIRAEVVADKAGNITTSDVQLVSVDLSAGTLTSQDSTSSVYESSLDDGSAPSLTQRETSGNIFDGNDIGNSTLSSFSANGQEATVWSENSNILTLTTDSGTLFIATSQTSQDGVEYSAGDYLYVLQNSSSSTVDTFTYTLSDTAGNSASADLNINIVDDKATINEDGAIHKYLSADTSGYTTNLILTLDVSGSMLFDADGSAPGDSHIEWNFFIPVTVDDYDESTIRIELAKDALQNLIDKYAELGDVNVQVITFSDTATASAMLSGDDAKLYIESLTADGGTMYDTAIAKAEENPIEAYPDANSTQYYFISDGEPNDGGGLTVDEQTAWNEYIASSPIDKTYAIGVGDSVNLSELEKIGSDNGETLIISSITDLDSTLIGTVNNTVVIGDFTSFDADGVAINMGADGGHITEISIFDQSGAISQTITYDATATSQTITTSLGGTLNVNFEDGSYSYTIDYQDSIAGKEERIDVSVVDSDGESVTNSVYIHLESSIDENFSYDTNAIDGGDGFDTLVLSGAQSLNFDNISNIQNIEAVDMSTGDNEILNLDMNDVINITDTNNELFIYGEAQDSVTLDATLIDQATTTTDSNGKVFDVYSDANATVIVNIEQEIVVS